MLAPLNFDSKKDRMIDMLDENVVASVVASAKEAVDPFLEPSRYADSLIRFSLEALGCSPETIALFALSESEMSLIASTLEPSGKSLIVCDVTSLFCLPAIIEGKFGDARCMLTSESQMYEGANELSELLSAGLDGISECFAGMVPEKEEMDCLAGYDSVFNLRRFIRYPSGNSNFFTFRPIALEKHSVWNALSSLSNYEKGLVLWVHLDGDGYEDVYSSLWRSIDNLSADLGMSIGLAIDRLPVPFFSRLSFVSKLPLSMKGWMFCWGREEFSYVGAQIELLDFSDQDEDLFTAGRSWTEIREAAIKSYASPVEICSNHRLGARFFLSDACMHVEEKTLGELSYEIRRGTSIAAKELEFKGSHNPFAPFRRREDTGYWYVDISDFWTLGRCRMVGARPIAQIPPGQDRYVVTPEDGLVVLIPRNGALPAVFSPGAPMLISNNLFLAKLKPNVVGKDYLEVALNSWFVREQLSAVKSVATKKNIEGLSIPIADERVRDLLVRRSKSLSDTIEDMKEQITLLELEDCFDFRTALRYADAVSGSDEVEHGGDKNDG